MNKLLSIAILTLITVGIIFFIRHTSKVVNTTLRNLQVNSKNVSEQLNTNITYVAEKYSQYLCSSQTKLADLLTSEQKAKAYPNFAVIFQNNSDVQDQVQTFLFEDSQVTGDFITKIVLIMSPMLAIFIVSCIGWFTYCSCCCYDYCPIVCRKKNKNKPYSAVEKYIPLIVVVFVGFSMIIPAALSYKNFDNAIASFNKLGCKLVISHYMLKTGRDLSSKTSAGEMIARWKGFSHDYDYFQKMYRNIGFLQTMDISETFGKIEEYEGEIQDIISQLDGYYTNFSIFENATLIYPNIRNKDLSRKVYPRFFKDFGDGRSSNTSQTLNMIKAYVNDHLAALLPIIKQIKYDMDYISDHYTEIVQFLDAMTVNYKSILELNDVSVNLLSLFDMIMYQLRGILDLVKISLLVSQLIVLLLIIALSLLIIAGIKGKWRFIGHGSWCLSSFNLVLMATASMLFYMLGSVLINMGTVIKLYSSNDMMSENISNNMKWLTCLNSFSPEMQELLYPNYSEMIGVMTTLTINLLKVHIFASSEPFEMDKFVNLMRNKFEDISDPETVIVYEDSDDPVPFVTLKTLLNGMVDYRNSVPYQIINYCKGRPTSFELVVTKSECTYPLIEDLSNILNFKEGKVCLLLQNLNSTHLEQLFKEPCTCEYTVDRFYEADLYSDLYDQLYYGHRIITSYYNQYLTWRDYTAKLIYDISSLYFATAMKFFQWLKIIDAKLILPVNTVFNFPLGTLGRTFLDKPIYFSRMLLKSNEGLDFTFMTFTSCTFYNLFTEELVDIMNHDTTNSIYILIVCYLFLIIYNSLSSIFGLISTLVNFTEEALDEGNNTTKQKKD